MTITYVAAGSATTGDNASVTPGAITGVTAGDLVLIQASIRSTGTGTVNTPSGWTVVEVLGSMTILGRFWQAGDSLPQVTFTGGAAGDDTIARAAAWRGVAPDALTASVTATQANASAANIAYPALDVPGDRHAVVLFAWKQDDATTYSTPSTFTAVGLTSTTTGNDASQAMYYVIQTTEADISSGSITVTGGASAVSSAILVALHPAASIATTTQVDYPTRVLVSVTNLVVGADEVEVYRSVASEETLLRAGTSANPVTDTSFLVVDAELPFGVAVTYVAVVNGGARYETSATTYTLTGGKVAATDAVLGLAAEVVIMAWPKKSRSRQSTTFQVGGKNIIVSGPLSQSESDITIYTETDSAGQAFEDLLDGATEGIIMLRQPGGYSGVDGWYAITSVDVDRFSQDGSDQRRTWTVHAVECDGWASALAATGWTLQDIYDFYGASGQLADLSSDYTTLLEAALADWS